jgi:1-acyl-sn-glycerol-3-phosphate acyltransferase
MPEPGPISVSSAAQLIVERILAFAGERPPDELASFRVRLEQLLASEPGDAVRTFVDRILTTGSEFTYFPPDPLARRVQHVVAEFVLKPDSQVLGAEHLTGVIDRPLLLLSNHLSYSDANLLEFLLRRAGCDSVADRLTVVVGPKVYSDPFRRFSSLCFGTIKTPQSATRSSDEAVMPPREVARRARQAIAAAMERQQLGDAILIFVEGTRSRKGVMQRALLGVARYLESPDTMLVPVAICGSERFVPIGVEQVNPTRVLIRVGRPALASDLAALSGNSRQLRMDAVGVAIARLLPPEYRGVYADGAPELAEATAVADGVFGASPDAQ